MNQANCINEAQEKYLKNFDIEKISVLFQSYVPTKECNLVHRQCHMNDYSWRVKKKLNAGCNTGSENQLEYYPLVHANKKYSPFSVNIKFIFTEPLHARPA